MVLNGPAGPAGKPSAQAPSADAKPPPTPRAPQPTPTRGGGGGGGVAASARNGDDANDGDDARDQNADADANADDADLFAAPPPDLVCPITHRLFRDPVLAASGHLYERAAILRHIGSSSSAGAAAACPLSGVSLGPAPHALLTPVHAARGRAMELRERTAAECVRRAAAAEDLRRCARLLRRAAELLDEEEEEDEEGEDEGASAAPAAAATTATRSRPFQNSSLARPPGFPPALGQFMLRHGGGGGDGGDEATAAKFFADALRAAGARDAAGAVYARLLLLESEGGDSRARAEYLSLCLACWDEEEGGGAVSRLADLFSPSSSSSSSSVLLPFSELLGRAGRSDPGILELLDRAAAVALCEKLISRRCRVGGRGGAEEARGGQAAGEGLALAARHARLLAEEARERAVEEAVGRAMAAAAAPEAAEGPGGAGAAGPAAKSRGRRLAAAALLTAATLAAPAAAGAAPLGVAAFRCARLAPLLYLVL
jgi:hypothetical protein